MTHAGDTACGYDWAVASKSVTRLSRFHQADWKQPKSVKDKGALTGKNKSSRVRKQVLVIGGSVWMARLKDKRYSGVNRLISPRVHIDGEFGSCFAIASWGRSRSQGYGCSPFKAVRELGSDVVRQFGPYLPWGRIFEESDPSTRGTGWTYFCVSVVAISTAG